MDRNVHLPWPSVVQPGSNAAGLHAGKKDVMGKKGATEKAREMDELAGWPMHLEP